MLKQLGIFSDTLDGSCFLFPSFYSVCVFFHELISML